MSTAAARKIDLEFFFQHWFFTIPVFSLELQPAAGSCLYFSLQVGVCSFVARYCTVPLLIHLLLVVCPLYHHYFFNRMSTTYLYCCTALQSLPLLLRSILLQVLLLFPLFGALVDITWMYVVQYGYNTGTIWVRYGYNTGTIRVRYGYDTGTIRVRYGYNTGTIRVRYGYNTGTIRVQYGYDTGTIRVRYGYDTGTIRVRYGYDTGTIRVRYGYDTGTIRVRYGYNTGTIRVRYEVRVMVNDLDIVRHVYSTTYGCSTKPTFW
jgi:uncharacterized beta-barrel protein YwiB (DUF1934 family)